MKKYEWILFDADKTLFHFDDFLGLQRMFSRYDVQFTAVDYETYQAINKPLWTAYQNGEITAKQLQSQRFNTWAQQLQVSPHDLNSNFMTAMADICLPLDGATSLLNTLRGKVKLGLITNGFTELQQIRLHRTGFQDHFNFVVISEEVGIAKPDPGIFEHAFSLMGDVLRENILMVGDTLESDILGGINVGIDTCWLNMDNKPISETITPRYQVTSLQELEVLLETNNN